MSEREYAAHSPLSRGRAQKARKNGPLVVHDDGSINAAASDAPGAEMTYPDQQRRSLGNLPPDVHIPLLRLLQRNLLQPANEDHVERKIGRIPSSLDLIDAALAYAEDAEASAKSAFERVRCQRDAAMIVFLAMVPIRRRSFVGLKLGRTLLVTDKEIAIMLAPEEVKNKKHYEIVLREPGAGLLRRYLKEARPFLLSRPSAKTDALWLADTGLAYSYAYIGKRIPLLTERLIGMKVPPHFFRDALATTFARESPDLARGTKAVLGHGDYRTSERHYNHAKAIDAGRSYSEILLELGT